MPDEIVDKYLDSDPNDKLQKISELTILNNQVSSCIKCNIRTYGCMYGKGNAQARLMLITNNPLLENYSLKFKSRFIITKYLNEVGIPLNTIYITSAVKCATGASNREPTTAEYGNCSEHLKNELAIINPRVTLIFGQKAFNRLCKLNYKECLNKITLSKVPYKIFTLIPTYSLSTIENGSQKIQDEFKKTLEMAYKISLSDSTHILNLG